MNNNEITLSEEQLEIISNKIVEKLSIVMKKNEDEKIKRKINQSSVERPSAIFKIS
jgi:hypothetical protein